MLQAIRRLSKTHLAMVVVCLLAVGGAVYFFWRSVPAVMRRSFLTIIWLSSRCWQEA